MLSPANIRWFLKVATKVTIRGCGYGTVLGYGLLAAAPAREFYQARKMMQKQHTEMTNFSVCKETVAMWIGFTLIIPGMRVLEWKFPELKIGWITLPLTETNNNNNNGSITTTTTNTNNN